jgi:hypothetical protein
MRSIIKQKKGLSVVVGYVLLITISLSLSILVYTWMKRQAPVATKECPDTLSIMLQEYSCTNSLKQLNLELKNNGLYNIQGLIIKGSDSASTPTKPFEFYSSSPIDKIKPLNDDKNNIEYVFRDNWTTNKGVSIILTYSDSEYIDGPKRISIIPLYLDDETKKVCSQQEIKQDIVCE